MSNKNFIKSYKSVHCIGIGGIGISGVAKFCLKKGLRVSGSDSVASNVTQGCEALGIKVYLGHDAANLPADCDLVVYSEAVPFDNPERVEARQRGISAFGHFDFFGELCRGYRTICVTGTNGKSTTTALTGKIFEAAGLDPTVFVGSLVPGWELGNVRVGQSDILIIEGDEYKRKMLALHPETTLITNIELDHTDIYHDLADVESAFAQLCRQTSKTIYQSWDDRATALAHSYDLTDGSNAADFRLYGTQISRPPRFFVGFGKIPDKRRIFEAGHQILPITQTSWFLNFLPITKIIAELKLKLPGRFNVMNALAAMALSQDYGVNQEVALKAIADFTGIWRRFERVGEFSGATIISDYGHHPTAVKATLQGAREFFPGRRIVLLFEPHQHNRTKELFNDFTVAFGAADVLILSEIYGVIGRTESGDSNVSSQSLLEAINQSEHAPKESHYTANLTQAEETLRSIIIPGDIVIVMGAGSVDSVARHLVVPTVN